MSSADSRTTSSSRLSQFGIYRSIDARTEEFLRLSRKRQIRQGCACAAVSTAITVTIVIVILLIYEYAIAVESSLVQKIRSNFITNGTNENDNPFADRLDRNFLGFDQDYYERMPLLVNAMQENSHVDPVVDTAALIKSKARYNLANLSGPTSSTFNHRTNLIRRTSPRPFYFENKSPTPTPFSKTYGSRSWIDSYRNAQRLKNLHQVIQYLEKTINAKFGDVYALPSSTIAFSGVYVEPTINQPKPTSPTIDLLTQDSNIVKKHKLNHQSSDPLYNYKPDSPGDVNLLADGFFRFSPVPTQSLLTDKFSTHIPMFRPITHRKRNCIGVKCIDTAESKITQSQETSVVETNSHDKLKTFSVMLNLFPLKPNHINNDRAFESSESTHTPINKIYITTSRPTVQFRRKSTTPNIRRTTTRLIRPRILPTKKTFKADTTEENRKPAIIEPKMIVHVNLYPIPERQDQDTIESSTHSTTSSTTTTTERYSTQIPILTSTQVEDYHVGSSGIISPDSRLTPAPPPPIPINIPSLPTPTTMIPFFDTITSSTEQSFRATNPPEILKFGHEDAKIPDHYKTLIKIEESTSYQPDINRRNFKDRVESNEDYEMETKTLIAKLKNGDDVTTTEGVTTENLKDYKESSTVKTYVPQINGHYRSVNQNSKNINTWIIENTQINRKKRLEMSVTGFRKTTYVPQYIEIKRNNTRNSSDKDDKETL